MEWKCKSERLEENRFADLFVHWKIYLKYLISWKSCAVIRVTGSLHAKRDVDCCNGIGMRGIILWIDSSSCE